MCHICYFENLIYYQKYQDFHRCEAMQKVYQLSCSLAFVPPGEVTVWWDEVVGDVIEKIEKREVNMINKQLATILYMSLKGWLARCIYRLGDIF